MFEHYHPLRAIKAFRFLLTIFVICMQKKSFLGLSPLSPQMLKKIILDLGVSFIKLAQVLATRADFFNQEYLRELRAIHDEVAPMPEQDLWIMHQRAFGPVSPFASFEAKPIASASIGQVHRARLEDGTLVAVKIRRLDIENRVRVDVRILRFFLTLFQPFFSKLTRNSLEAVLNEFSAMIVKEVDMAIELDNLRKFKDAYQHPNIYIPEYYPEYCSHDALVMSFERGLRIDDKDGLNRMGISFAQVMENLISWYTQQMLVKGLFHADPHPGNILVRQDASLIILDFGMVKRLPNSTRVAMIELLKAANERDFELFSSACERLGLITATAPPVQIQEFAERMFDIFSNVNLSAASMQALAFEVMDSMKDFPFKLPQEVVFVMRASTLIEGLGTTYIENFNGVKDILPVLKDKLPQALGMEDGLISSAKREIVALPLTMRRIKTVITEMSEGNLKVRLSRNTLESIDEYIRAFMRPVGMAILLMAGAFFILLLELSFSRILAGILFFLGAIRLWMAMR